MSDLNGLANTGGIRMGTGKRSAKQRRLRATVRHYLLALDTEDKEKLFIEEKKLREYSGYDGWPYRASPGG